MERGALNVILTRDFLSAESWYKLLLKLLQIFLKRL